MLNWLRRRDRAPKYAGLQSILTDLLHIQRSLIAGFSLIRTDGSVNEAAIGYIYGFIDCAAQIEKLEIDCDEGYKLITDIIESLESGCGKDLSLRTICFLKNSNKDFMNAAMVGGSEYNN